MLPSGVWQSLTTAAGSRNSAGSKQIRHLCVAGRKRMDTDSIFKKENIELLFEAKEYGGSFIAAANDGYSEFMEGKAFGREWSRQFPAGRYVIIVYQRHSVYVSGKRIWLNGHFENAVGRDSRYRNPCFVIVLDKATEYEIKSWKDQRLLSNVVCDAYNPLQPKLYSLKEADIAAKDFSATGCKSALMEWFDDYDMY